MKDFLASFFTWFAAVALVTLGATGMWIAAGGAVARGREKRLQQYTECIALRIDPTKCREWIRP